MHRVLIVDDRPDVRLLLRTRLGFEPDIEVVGEAVNGAEAVTLVRGLAPGAVLLDLEMPVMRGDEAIPLMREVAPGMGILLYTGANDVSLPEEATPDVIVRKGGPLAEVVTALRALLERAPYDVLRLELGRVPLHQAISAFDTWTGLNMRVLEALERGDDLNEHQLSGASIEELEALMSVYAHIGNNLQKAARDGSADVAPVVHVFRATGVAARGALLAFNNHRLPEFWKAWGYDVPQDAVTALALMRDRLMEVLPASTAAVNEPTPTGPGEEDDTEALLATVREKQHALETLAHDTGAYGPESPRIAPSLEHAGRVERDLGNLAGARERYARALELEEASAGADDPATAHCREQLETLQVELERCARETRAPG